MENLLFLGVPILKHIRVLNRALAKREYLMIIFLFLIKTVCCDPSSESSRRDGSDEASQHAFKQI